MNIVRLDSSAGAGHKGMMKHLLRPARLSFAGSVLACLLAIGMAEAQAPAPALVVVEHFTSQGCSSCPPGDRLMRRLASEPGILVLSRPVTYWDSLGWKDTLARRENTALQQAYQGRIEGRPGVYTPQAVVDGAWGGVGSGETALRQAIENARPATAKVQLERIEGARLRATIQAPIASEVVLVGYRPDVEVAVQRGENGGRTLHYANVVVGETILGRTGASPARFEASLEPLRAKGAEAFAVLVETQRAGRILGAGKLE